MFQRVIDLRPRDNFGARILQGLLAKERLAMEREQLKLQQDAFKLQQEQVEFQQQRDLQTALGTAAGLGAGQAEGATQAVQRAIAPLAGIIPGAAAAQAGLQAAPTGEQQLAGLESPFAQAAGATALAEERQRTALRTEAARRTTIAERTQAETVRWHDLTADYQDRQLKLEEKLGNARIAQLEAQTEAQRAAADRQMAALALETAKDQQTEFRELAKLYGSAELASLLVYGQAKPPTRQEATVRSQRIIDALASGAPELAAEYLNRPSPSVIGHRLGVDPELIAQYEALQTQEGIEAVSNEEFLFGLYEAIDRSGPPEGSPLSAREWQDEQRQAVRLWLIGITDDPTLGAELGIETGAQRTTRGRRPPADFKADVSAVLSRVQRVAEAVVQSQQAFRR